MSAVRDALELLPATCRYHGEKIERAAWPRHWPPQPCCDTGAPALARRKALAEWDAMELMNNGYRKALRQLLPDGPPLG